MKSEVSGLYWSLRMKFKIGLISAAILLSGCATQKMAFPTQNQLTITGNTLVYDGMITGDAVLEAIRMVNDSDQKVTTLRITSSGGDIGVGIEFGHFIKKQRYGCDRQPIVFFCLRELHIACGEKCGDWKRCAYWVAWWRESE